MIVLDTNVVSEALKGPRADLQVWRWLQAHSDELVITAVTVTEIRSSVLRLPAGKRRDELIRDAFGWLDDFDDAVLPFDAPAAVAHAAMTTELHARGRVLPGFDALIAAICLSRDAGLATRNVKDFEDTGVDVHNPWRWDG